MKREGIEVIITDHHEPAEAVPKGVPLIDPKCGNNPSSILAGAGVALKAIQALGARLGKPHLWRSLVDLATLGTIADLMPMVDVYKRQALRYSLIAEPFSHCWTYGRGYRFAEWSSWC